jgi:inner membrane protein YidH
METRIGSQPGADVRDYLAEERTFLAWIRTGLALMAFGFVVARFGLYLAEIQISQGSAAIPSHWFSLWSGTGFIAAGVAMNLWSIRRHLRVVRELNRGQFDRGPSRQAVILALFLALVGVATVVRLTLG